MLTGEELATGFFTHCSGAGGAIGLVCRHLGEEAFGKKKRIKNRFEKERSQTNILYKADGYIDKEEMTGEYSRKEEKSTRYHVLRLYCCS